MRLLGFIITLLLMSFQGGITFLTLMINGSTSGLLLRKLKLDRATKERMDILSQYDAELRKSVLDNLMVLLGEQSYYNNVNFDLIRQYVPQLCDLKYTELRLSIRRIKYTRPSHLYEKPNLILFESILSEREMFKLERVAKLKLFERIQSDSVLMFAGPMPDELNDCEQIPEEKLKEMRLVFIEVLRNAYQRAMNIGHIDVRNGIVIYVLNNSVATAENEISNGMPINDWKACESYNSCFVKFERTSTKVHLAAAFIHAHTEAQRMFKYKIHQEGFLSTCERQVLEESSQQISLAYEALHEVDAEKLKRIISLKLCVVLKHGAAKDISEYIKAGLMKEEEGEHYFEHLEKEIYCIKVDGMKKSIKVNKNQKAFVSVIKEE